MSEQKRLFRTSSDRVLGGVAGGVARYFEIDPVFARLGFGILALINGLGVLIYFIMWLVVPDEDSRAESGEDTVRANAEDIKQRLSHLAGSVSSGQGASILAMVLIGLGTMFLLREFVPAVPDGVVMPAVLIAVGVYFLFGRRENK